jgi:Tol biopolymer transport system component
MRPVWSPDGRYIVAHRDRAQLLLFDLRTRQWTELANGLGLGRPYWSHDGKYVYYQEEFGGPEQAISRVRVSNRKVERMMDLKHVPQSNVTAYFFGGLTPDDAPIVSVSRSNSDIYALDLKLP